MLEDRLVPTQFIWTNGTSDGLVSTAANWTDPLGGPSAVPGSGDYAYFGAGGSGSNTAATVDLSSWSVDRIVMDANYTATLAVPSGNAVTTSNHFVQYGTLQLTGSAALTAGTYFDINGAVVATESSTLTATMTTTGDFVLNTGATITVLGGNYSQADLAISTGGFEAFGTINVGSTSGSGTDGDLAITGPFSQDAGGEINVVSVTSSGSSTLAFTAGTSGEDTMLQGETNLLGTNTTGVVVSSTSKLAVNGGTLNALGAAQTLIGDVAVFGGGEIYVGDPVFFSAQLDIATGSLTIGAPDPNSASTGGVVNLDLTSTLFLSATSTSTFVLKSDSELVLEGGATIWMNTGFSALEIPEAETGLTAGKLISSNGDNFIFGSLINHGIIEFGGTLHALNISRDYIQGEEGVLGMRLKNTGGLVSNDLLYVGGDAEIDGGLFLSAIESLSATQTWTLIDSNSLSGNFASIYWPDSDSWAVVAPPNGFSFRIQK